MISVQIKNLRKAKKISQSELAKVLNVTTGAIGLWETGRREPDYEMLIKIANFFNVTVDYLIKSSSGENIIILGSNGSYKSFLLNEKDLKSIEVLAESLEKTLNNSIDIKPE